ncbi:MAG: HDOD domain-containing protein [Desulfopila sp.]
MEKEEILRKVINSSGLPTLPSVASKLLSLMAKQDTPLAEIADLIRQDVSLSAKLLKVANSAFYSFPQQIGSIRQAVSLLGVNAVCSLVLSFSFLSMKRGNRKSVFNFEKFREHALAAGVGAKLIVDTLDKADIDEIFICGLLQNMGELVLVEALPQEYEEIVLITSKERRDLCDVEMSRLGITHAEIGYHVARHWGFPEALQLSILYHHDPRRYQGDNKRMRQMICAVYLSDLLVNILFSDTPESYHTRFREEAKSILGLTNKEIDAILSDLHLQVEQSARYFNLKINNPKSVQEILQEANIRLSLMNLDYAQMNKQLVLAKIALEKLTRELEEKNRMLDNLANIDGLTEVCNHRCFQITLEQEISRAIRRDYSLSLIMIDIDHFKEFNDKYDHQTGDFVLKSFATTIKARLRNYDTLARYGGEEFVVILPETNEEEAVIVAEKLRQVVEEHIFADNRNEYRLTASFGVTSCRPATIEDFSKSLFINQADQAMYEAKSKGRNRVAVHVRKKKWYSFS